MRGAVNISACARVRGEVRGGEGEVEGDRTVGKHHGSAVAAHCRPCAHWTECGCWGEEARVVMVKVKRE